jgi:endonuclease/exonuclease/phosphatase (EEP) superfamily protein YafD
MLAVAIFGLPALLGLLAPLVPQLELPNHFRLFLLLGAMMLLAFDVFVRRLRRPWPAIGLVGLNLALTALPMTPAALSPPMPPVNGEPMKLVSFNLWTSGRHADIVRFIEDEAPDVVMFQELRASHVAELLPRLKPIYRHQAVCEGCNIALLSKLPLSSVDTSGTLPLVSAIWTSPKGTAYRIAGVHLPWPFLPERQEQAVNQIIATINGWSEPRIIAGDFNLTPWSWKLNKLLWQTGLKRHGSFERSWPVVKQFKSAGPISQLPLPALLLIDNVLASPDITADHFETGEDLGSDHLPIVARMTLP